VLKQQEIQERDSSDPDTKPKSSKSRGSQPGSSLLSPIKSRNQDTDYEAESPIKLTKQESSSPERRERTEKPATIAIDKSAEEKSPELNDRSPDSPQKESVKSPTYQESQKDRSSDVSPLKIDYNPKILKPQEVSGYTKQS